MSRSSTSCLAFALFATFGLAAGCSDDGGAEGKASADASATEVGDGDGDPETDSGSETSGDGDGETSGDGDGDGDGDNWGYWAPGKALATEREPNARGFLDRRGLIHAHSVHSHDACDGEPKDGEGNYDAQCDRDLREGLCRARHDFVFLTDHADSFTITEYPETLLYRTAYGDQLVEVDGVPVANWTGCEGFDEGNSGSAPFVPTLIQAGCESATMPIGLPAHLGATEAERKAALGDSAPAGIMALADAGAVTLVAHTEEWTAQELTELPLDGFEMYNIHANLFLNIADVGALLSKLGDEEALPHSDLILLPLMSEDPAYLDTWSEVLSTGARKLTTMGTDCHRNTFPELLPDGERIDSYERMIKWFSNHLLVESSGAGDPQAFGVEALHEALDAGRLFGVFELLGVPVGFDYYGEQNGDLLEIGAEPSLGEGALTLRVVGPTVALRDPETAAPMLQLRLLRAGVAGWEEVGFVEGVEGSGVVLEVEVEEAGAYRGEVRILPRHLEAWLGDYAGLAEQAFVWIYANPIYVRV